MKIKYTIALLIILTNYYFPSQAMNRYNTTANIISSDTQIELTKDEKIKIVKDVQKHFTPFKITLNSNEIIDQNVLKLSTKLKKLPLKNKQDLLTQISKFTWLTSLYLRDNNLSSLPNTIKNLSNLTRFSLQKNNFTSVPNPIGRLTNLIYIDFSYNQLGILPSSISNLINLEEADFSFNRLQSLPDTIKNLTKLTKLDLPSNKLITIPSSIGKIDTLIALCLTDNPQLLPNGNDPSKWGKTELKDHFGDHVILDPPSAKPVSVKPKKNLSITPTTNERNTNSANARPLSQRTNIVHSTKPRIKKNANQISTPKKLNKQIEITDAEKKMIIEKAQKEFYCYYTHFHSFGIFFGEGIHFGIFYRKEIHFYNNIFLRRHQTQQKLLSYITKFTWLTHLDLPFNQIMTIPDTIENLNNLTYLGLCINQLTSFPNAIENLNNLKDLSLNHNYLVSLPCTIEKLNKLICLSISRNRLISLPHTIGNLSNLRSLYLDDNKLTTIPASIKNIKTLTLLDLRNNPHLLPRSDNPLEWGKEELRAHFGNRVYFSDPAIKLMLSTTTEQQINEILDKFPLRINRINFTVNKLPDIKVDQIYTGEEMLEALTLIMTSINFHDETQPGYLSYELLANDFASDAKNQNLSNVDKVWTYVMPRLTGYIKTLYNLPLEEKDISGWKMYASQIPETQNALTYIMGLTLDTDDPDTKMLLFNQLVNGLLHCPTGQAEGINSVVYALAEGVYYNNNFKNNLKRLLAIKKNAHFTYAILAKGAENSQNVHLISKYRDQLKEDLGLTSAIASYKEKIGSMGQDPFVNNKWNVVHVFYDLVSPHRLIQWVMEKSETIQDQKNFRKQFKQDKNLSPAEKKIALQQIKQHIKENIQSRPFTTGDILAYLQDEKRTEEKDWWQKYFTEDPYEPDSFAILTRDGTKAILIHEGFLIEDF
jgi:Leucine-rich repeat (LRR) protein